MNKTELRSSWKQEENAAHIHGWDFSHIAGRYTEETDLPWDYQRIVLEHLKPEMKLLDIDTGGGEFCCPCIIRMKIRVQQRPIRRTYSCANRRFCRSALISARETEKMHSRLTIPRLTL